MNESKQKAKELINQVNISIQQNKLYLNKLKIEDNKTNSMNEELNELKEKIENERKNFKK